MLRFFTIFLVSLLLTSQMIPSGHAAVKWNNGGVKDDKSDPEKYWRKAEKAKECYGPAFDHFKDGNVQKKISVSDDIYASISTPFGLNNRSNANSTGFIWPHKLCLSL